MPISDRAKKKFLQQDTTAKGKERTANKLLTRDMNFHNGFTAAYDEMEKMLKQLAKGNQLDLLERVYSGLLHHATRNEEGVEMVILTPSAKKAFSELTFGPELREALDDYNLVVNRGASEKMHLLQIFGTPKTSKAKAAMGSSKEMLVQYRSYQQKGAVRNIIEMGNLLKELADWEKIEASKAQKLEPSLPEPVAMPAVAPSQPVEPAPQAMPSNTTTIDPVTQPPVSAEPEYSTRDELERVRRNAGITVE